MAGRIELPDLVQRIKISTEDFARADRELASFSRIADERLDSATESQDEYRESVDKTIDAEEDHVASKRNLIGINEEEIRSIRKLIEEDEKRRTRRKKNDDEELSDARKRLQEFYKNSSDMGTAIGNLTKQLKLPVIAGGISAIGGAVSAVGAGLLAISAQFGPVIGLAGSLPGLATALGQVGIAATVGLKPAIEGFTALKGSKDDVLALGGALEDLTNQERRFAFALQDLTSSWGSLSDSLSNNVLPGVTTSIRELADTVPVLSVGLEEAAGSFGRFASDFSGLVSTPAFRNDLRDIFAANVSIIDDFGEAGIGLIDILRTITVAAIPMTRALSEIVAIGTINLADKFQGFRDDGSMEAFFNRALEVGRVLGNAFKDFGVTLYNVGQIANQTIGIDFVQNLKEGAAQWRAFTGSVEGAETIGTYFADAGPILSEVWSLIKDITVAFIGLGDNQDLVDFVRRIREDVLPSFVELAEGVTPRVTDLIVNLMQAFLEFSDMLSFSPLIELVSALAASVAFLTETISDIPGLGTLVAGFIALQTVLKSVNIYKLVFGVGGPTAISKGFTSIATAVNGATGALGKFRAGAGALVGAFNPAMAVFAGVGIALGLLAQANADAKARVDALTEAMREQQGVATQGVFQALADSLTDDFIDKLDRAGIALDDYLQIVTSAEDPEQALRDAVAESNLSYREQRDILPGLLKNLRDRRNEIEDARNAIEKSEAAERAAAAATRDSAYAQDEARIANQRLREELARTNAEYDKLIERLQLANAEFLAGLVDQADYYESLERLREAVKNGFSIDVKTEEGRKDVRAFASFIDTAMEDVREAFKRSPEEGIAAYQTLRSDIESLGIPIETLDQLLANDRKLNLQIGKAAVLGEIAEIQQALLDFETERDRINAEIASQEDLLGSAVPEYLKQNARDRIAELKNEKVELRATLDVSELRTTLNTLKETTRKEKIELGATLATGKSFDDAVAELVKAKSVKVKPEVDPKSKKGAQDEIENDVEKKGGKVRRSTIRPVIDPDAKSAVQTILDVLTKTENKTITVTVLGPDGKPFDPSKYTNLPPQVAPVSVGNGGSSTNNQTNNYNVNVNAGSSTITDQGLTNKLRRIRA